MHRCMVTTFFQLFFHLCKEGRHEHYRTSMCTGAYQPWHSNMGRACRWDHERCACVDPHWGKVSDRSWLLSSSSSSSVAMTSRLSCLSCQIMRKPIATPRLEMAFTVHMYNINQCTPKLLTLIATVAHAIQSLMQQCHMTLTTCTESALFTLGCLSVLVPAAVRSLPAVSLLVLAALVSMFGRPWVSNMVSFGSLGCW